MGSAFRFSLIVPAYNEALNIQPFLRAVHAALAPDFGNAWELLVVDDDSPDRTWELAESLQKEIPPLKVVRRIGERGLAGAVLRGWQEATGDVLGTINADFQHPPALLPQMLQLIERADVVVASRYVQGGGAKGWPFHRLAVANIARYAGLIVAPRVFRRVSDPLSGYYLFRRSVIEGVQLKPIGFKTLIEVLSRGRVETICEVGYPIEVRRNGSSKLRLRDCIGYLVHLRRIRRAVARS